MQKRAASEGKTRVLLEMTAGQGSCVGYRFEHLAAIIKAVEHKIPIGVTIDTCHIFAAGYDIRHAGWMEKNAQRIRSNDWTETFVRLSFE